MGPRWVMWEQYGVDVTLPIWDLCLFCTVRTIRAPYGPSGFGMGYIWAMSHHSHINPILPILGPQGGQITNQNHVVIWGPYGVHIPPIWVPYTVCTGVPEWAPRCFKIVFSSVSYMGPTWDLERVFICVPSVSYMGPTWYQYCDPFWVPSVFYVGPTWYQEVFSSGFYMGPRWVLSGQI